MKTGLATTAIIAGAVVLMFVIGLISLNVRMGADRFQEFRMACLEQGGSVVLSNSNHQCQRITTVDIKD